MNEVELSYYTGVIDSEGCFDIFHNKNYYARFQMTTTSKELMSDIHSFFGLGTLSENKTKTVTGKTTYTWRVSTKDIQNFIQMIYPYMKTKKPEAEIILGFSQNKETLTEKQKQSYLEILRMMKKGDLFWNPLKNVSLIF